MQKKSAIQATILTPRITILIVSLACFLYWVGERSPELVFLFAAIAATLAIFLCIWFIIYDICKKRLQGED